MRVLVVEDEPLIATSIQWELIDAGYEVVGPAAGAEDAEALMADGLPDLALVDINLTERGEGVGLARRLKARGVASVFVTGQVHEARQNRDAALGLVLKPFPIETLGRVVQALEGVMTGHGPVRAPRCLELFDAPKGGRGAAGWSSRAAPAD